MKSLIDSTHDRDYWRALVNATLNIGVPEVMGLVRFDLDVFIMQLLFGHIKTSHLNYLTYTHHMAASLCLLKSFSNYSETT